MNGYFKPEEAFEIAKKLHVEGKFDVYIRLQRVKPMGPRYQGDDERRLGKTATMSVDFDYESSIDEIAAVRDKVRDLGYDSELDVNALTILGKWHG